MHHTPAHTRYLHIGEHITTLRAPNTRGRCMHGKPRTAFWTIDAQDTHLLEDMEYMLNSQSHQTILSVRTGIHRRILDCTSPDTIHAIMVHLNLVTPDAYTRQGIDDRSTSIAMDWTIYTLPIWAYLHAHYDAFTMREDARYTFWRNVAGWDIPSTAWLHPEDHLTIESSTPTIIEHYPPTP